MDHAFFQDYLGMRTETVDMTEFLRRMERGIYDREEFEARYGGEEYRRLRTRYDPDGRLLDLYDKVVGRK